MNTRKLRGIRKFRDVVKELNGTNIEVILSGKQSDGFEDKVIFSLSPDNAQDILITGVSTKMELRVGGDSIVSVKRLRSGGFRVKLNDKNFKSLFLIPKEQVEEEGGE